MTLEHVVMLVLLALIFALFFREVFPPELTALGASAVLLATGILTSKDFLSVFANPAPITIAMMFILSAALERTGVLQSIGRRLQKAARGSYLRAIGMMMVVTIGASALMNNTPVVILLTPIMIGVAASVRVSASKLLMPLSFAAIFGGTLTLVGTSTNILMSGVAEQAGLRPISMFEMTLPGLVFAAAGALYMIWAGHRLLPDRTTLTAALGQASKRHFTASLRIPPGSVHIGRRLADLPFDPDEARVIDVIRRGVSLRTDLRAVQLEADDRIVLRAGTGEILGLTEGGQVVFRAAGPDLAPVEAEKVRVMEASIGPNSPLRGRKVGNLRLRRKYGVYIAALHRQDRNMSENLEDLRLQFADTLLLEGSAEGMARLLEDGGVINLSDPGERPMRRPKAPLAILTILAVVTLSALGVMDIAGLAVIGAVIVMAAGCIDPDEAFAAIDWRILFLIFGMLGFGLGMEKTGTAELIVSSAAAAIGDVPPVVMLAFVYVLTSTLTELISNNAVAVLIGPIAIALAETLGYDPRPFVMAVMFAASASFATPIGYQTNTFVYSAGGYRFADFLRVGLPLNVIFAVLAVLILPIFFPFQP
ncbi:SLC13 family permease [Roseivivax sp. CAU 1761]